MINKQQSLIGSTESLTFYSQRPEKFDYQGSESTAKVEFSTPEKFLCQDQKPDQEMFGFSEFVWAHISPCT